MTLHGEYLMSTLQPRKRINYLNNADMLCELHKSKMSFCSTHDERYFHYDLIVKDISQINASFLQSGIETRQKRITSNLVRDIQKKQNCTPKQALAHLERRMPLPELDNITIYDVVVRVMDNGHIPYEDENDSTNSKKIKTNFKPFKHVVLHENGELEEVVWSHWKGSIQNGEFCQKHGKITNELANMFVKLSDKIGTKGCFRGYSFLDEMKSTARFQLIKNALLFDESRETKQLNPFAYYTTVVSHAFMAILNDEKKRRNMRDDLLEANGFDPSITRLVEIEEKMIRAFHDKNNTPPDSDDIDGILTYDD